jgi:hypothetical protein
LLDEGRAITRSGRAAIRKMNPKLVEIIEKAGVKIHTLTPGAARRVREGHRRRPRQGEGQRRVDQADVETIEAGLADFKAKSSAKR